MAKNIGNFFFVIFGQVDVFYILVEFEVDGMRPNESTKNGQKGAHGLNCKICLSDNFKIFVIQPVWSIQYGPWLYKKKQTQMRQMGWRLVFFYAYKIFD